MYEINVHTLALEVTRCCNMDPPCEICLRGHAQDMSLSSNDLRTVLKQISHVNEVLFTGGEPTLNLQAIRKFIELAEIYHVEFDSFYIVTNGIENQKELALLTLQMYQDAEAKEYCGIALSQDAWHNDKDQHDLIKGLAYYKPDKEHKPGDDERWILKVGNAADNDIGHVNPFAPTEFEIEVYYKENGKEVDCVYVDLIYLSCNGYVYPDANMSYRDMDAKKTVAAKDLAAYITNASKKPS